MTFQMPTFYRLDLQYTMHTQIIDIYNTWANSFFLLKKKPLFNSINYHFIYVQYIAKYNININNLESVLSSISLLSQRQFKLQGDSYIIL